MIINLISDTVTKPSAAMLEYMFKAQVGDDVFRADPSANELENYVAEKFQMEAALFCPSGTMCNQIAIALHCSRLSEVICDKDSHIFQYETGGYAYNSGVAIKLIDGNLGKITPPQIESAINPSYDWLSESQLVVLENSCNRGGGNYYTLKEIKEIRHICDKYNLKLHLDGARLFNVLVETNEKPEEYGKYFDTISICLSKGLGAPVGSLLIGSKENMILARRLRKVMGGGMRQVGYMAAAGLFALKNHISLLKKDNERAKDIERILSDKKWVKEVLPVKTNIVIFHLREPILASECLKTLEAKGILASAFGPSTVRFVTHLDISEVMYQELKKKLEIIEL